MRRAYMSTSSPSRCSCARGCEARAASWRAAAPPASSRSGEGAAPCVATRRAAAAMPAVRMAPFQRRGPSQISCASGRRVCSCQNLAAAWLGLGSVVRVRV
jgi:hypothetical protein